MRGKVQDQVFEKINAIRVEVRVREPWEMALARAVRKGIEIRWILDLVIDPIKINLFRELRSQCGRR